MKGSDKSTSGFPGLTHYDQRGAGSGSYTNTQFSLEPPDQAVCVGNGYVLESVNTALAAYSTTGQRLTTPIALNQFLGLKPEVQRNYVNAQGQTQALYGDFSSDPRCLYDPASGRFFLSVLQIDMDPVHGTFGPRSHLEIAVSRTSDPTKDWYVYSVDITDDGLMGTPLDPGCPCFGDQPLIGINANGFYVSTNEFNTALANGGLGLTNGAQLYEFSKFGLVSGTMVPVVQIAPPTDAAGNLWTSVEPASTPPGVTEPSGTEYFLAAHDSGSGGNDVGVFALTGTDTIDNAKPSVALAGPALVPTESYGQPVNATQKDGNRPLGQAQSPPEGPEQLATNDDRMYQVMQAKGTLWSSLNTTLDKRAGEAWFAVAPTLSGSNLTAKLVKQGYISLASSKADVMFGSVGVNSAGRAVMGLDLSGDNTYPSTGWVRLDTISPSSPPTVHVTGVGTGPEDGFTGYTAYNGNGVARWGDYSAAAVGPDGSFWLAGEYIPNSARTQLANWGTYVTHTSG